MKKLFTLFFVALLGLGQAWAISKTQLTVNISGNGQIAVNTTAAQPAGWSSTSVTKDQGHGTFDVQVTDYYYIWVNPNTGYYCSGVSDCTWDNSGYYTISFKGSTTTNKKTVTATFVGNSYTLTFDGNGATSGTMANQSFVYGTAQNIRANAFARQFAVTFNANGGECAETEATATATFAGWAKSANGEVVYANQQSLSTPTPLPAHNSTINLFAQWTPATVVLPEVSREGLLFDGWYNGDVWAGNIGDAYTATADAELTAHWAEKRTPVFVLDKTEIELDQTAQLTMNNVNNPSIEIAPAGIVNYDAETGKLTGVGVGEVTITATQQETDELSYKQEVLTLTVGKKTASLSVILNGIEQSSVVIYQGKTTTVAFNKVSDAEVEVSVVSGGQYASYQNGVVTAGEIGKAVFRATLPETQTYKTTYVDFTVETQRNPIHLPMTFAKGLWNNTDIKVQTGGTTGWDDSKGIVLGDASGGGFNYDDKYVILHFEGIPDKLTFEIAADVSDAGSLFGGVTDVEWYIQESKTQNMGDVKIWTETRDSKEFSATQTVQLDPTTRYVKLCYSGNFAGDFRNVKISELKYVQDPEPATIDFGKAVIYTGEVSKTVNINWCNIAPMTVESSNPRFTVSPSVFANYDQMGSQEITISYTHTAEVGANEADITISNGNEAYNKTIHVSAETIKRTQTVTWNPDLEATGFAMNVGEQYPDEYITVIATTPSGEQITYVSSDNAVVEVINDTILLAKAKGTAYISAYQAGDAEYEEAKDTVLFTVTDLRKQTIIWDQNLYGLLTTGEPIELTATATSGMEITYTSGNESVVRVEGNTLIIVGEGETSITAYQAGGLDTLGVEWLPISLTNYVIVRNPASQCNEMALTVGSLTLSEGNLAKEYALAGTPTTLTFSAKHGEKSGWGGGIIKPTYAALMVDQYTKVDGVWGWQNIYNTVVGTDATASGTIQLDEIATKLRFRTTETGTEHTITDIRVPRKKFMRVDVAEVDENVEANAIWRQNITVSHSNIDLMSLSTKQGLLTLSANTLGGGCGDYGDAVFEASYTPTQKFTEYLDTIVISDGKAQPTTIEIPVRLYAAGLNQYITGFELPATCLTTEIIEVPQATSTSGLEVVYLSSDSTIAYVENNVLVILSAGDVEITAYQAGNDRYREVSISKTISIQLTPVQILVDPTATEVAYGEAVGMALLRGGEAEVEGTFRWADPEQVMTESMECQVVFIPTLSAIFATATTMVYVTVTDHPVTYGEYAIQFCAGDSAEYEGKWYYAAIQEDVTLAEKNRFGGDSIVTLTVTVLQHSAYAEEMTITYGDAAMWNGHDLSVEPVGTRDLVYETTNAVGCDSIVTLTLTVSKQETLEVPVELVFCEGGAEEYRGVVYDAAGDFDVPAEGTIRDTLYKVNVTVHPVFAFAEEETVYVDSVFEWQGAIRATNEVGTFTIEAPYTTVNGCDSIYTLTLHVEARPTTYGTYEARFCEGDSVEYAGEWYYEATQTQVTLAEKNSFGGDSIVTLTVSVDAIDLIVLPNDTMYVGDTVTIDEEGWVAYMTEVEVTMQLAVGEYVLDQAEEIQLSRTLQNENGCDSITTLLIIVEPKPSIPTALESVQANPTAVKEFRNGVIYIRRENAVYTVSGERVK